MGKLRIGLLLSGGGRTLENLVARISSGELDAEVAMVISSHEEAFGLERARRHGIPREVISHRGTGDRFSGLISERLDAAGVDLVAMGGFIRRWVFPDHFRNKVLNIHPALLPAFGGKGFYGDRVHQAVLEAGVKTSGCTVHFVDEEYDQGPIILQRVVPVLPDDTPATLAERVFEQECIAYPEAIQYFGDGRLQVESGLVTLKPRRE